MKFHIFLRLPFLALFILCIFRGIPYIFWLSPYIAILTILSEKKFYFWMLFSVIVFVLSLKFQRGFCRYFCPTGTLLSLFPSARLHFPAFLKGICLPFLMFSSTLSFFGINMGFFDPLVAFSKSLSKDFWASTLFIFLLMNLFGRRRWCTDFCPLGALFSLLERRPLSIFLKERRVLLSTLFLGILSSIFLKRGKEKLLFPPNADKNLYLLCIRCSACIRVCPEGIITPFITVNLPYFLLPILCFSKGSCLKECNRCSKACPTGAIRAFKISEKERVKIGIAKILKRECIYYRFGSECLMCMEHCPYQAIMLDEAPIVNEQRCTGCGRCEYICPVGAAKVYPLDERGAI